MTHSPNWNQGNALMPQDIKIIKVNEFLYHAYSGFYAITSKDEFSYSEGEPKYVQASGKTAKEAKDEVIQAMVEMLNDVKENG